MTVEPCAFWRSRGVAEPFSVFNIMLAYSDMDRAMADMVRHLKQDLAPIIEDQELRLDLGRESRIVGYIGHNIYYGGACGIDRLEHLDVTATAPRGLFFLGCQSRRWCSDKFSSPRAINLILCETNMAPEGYIMLALLDGLSRGLGETEMIGLCNRVYGLAQGRGSNIKLFVTGPAH